MPGDPDLTVIEGRVPAVTSTVPIGGRTWRITSVQNQDALLDSADQLEHFPYGFLLWESAIGLARYLYTNPSLVEGRQVLELGAGVGVAGIAARALSACVRQTDHQKGALLLAEHNADQNGISGIDQFLDDWRTWSHRERYDVLLGADITYERAMHFYLEQIFDRNLKAGGTVLLSDPGRPQSLEFAARLEQRGWQIALETVHVSLADFEPSSKPVDVAIFRLTR